MKVHKAMPRVGDEEYRRLLKKHMGIREEGEE